MKEISAAELPKEFTETEVGRTSMNGYKCNDYLLVSQFNVKATVEKTNDELRTDCTSEFGNLISVFAQSASSASCRW